MGMSHLRQAVRERVRSLCRCGWTPEAIAHQFGLAEKTVATVLRDARLLPAAAPKSPILDYTLPDDDDSALTPLQQEERHVSRMRIFDAQVMYDMTESSARKAVGMGTLQLAACAGITPVQARLVQASSTKFLRTLHRWRKNPESADSVN